MESEQTKRGRGRPKGASRYLKADTAILVRVAEAIFRDPALKPTTALKRQGLSDESAIRRLQRRWRVKGPSLVVEARRREEGLSSPRAETVSRNPLDAMDLPGKSGTPWNPLVAIDATNKLGDASRFLDMRKMAEIQKQFAAFTNPFPNEQMKAIQAAFDNPVYRSMATMERLNEPFRKLDAINRQIEMITRMDRTIEAVSKVGEAITKMTRGY